LGLNFGTPFFRTAIFAKMISTPDQRVRVFVSSTLEELAEERKVVRKAIEELRLIPVMFELGARAHPPRQLYQAYLEQSDVFIGIYWNQYGWTAPEMDISGLEDEYRMSGSKPRLIYVKSSTSRDPRLDRLIRDIEKQGSLAYKLFQDLRELQEYIENDLAALLSEKFRSETQKESPDPKIFFNNIPQPYHELIGRQEEKKNLEDLLLGQHKRLITLTGMGGTGKSRLAIEIGFAALAHFEHGVCFVSLGSIRDHDQLESCIALALGLSNASSQALRETLLSYLSDKRLLLILDNFEHVLEGAGLLSDILSRTRQVSILVTSRSSLNLRAEWIFPLSPLPVSGKVECGESGNIELPSLKLFMERANSVNPRINWNTDNLEAAAVICFRLGGLPLAIELAAMRTKYNSPVQLLKGMEKSLDLLTGGARDLPGRQQSFRATLDWSYRLLSPEDQEIFRIMSIFQDGWYADTLRSVSGLPAETCAAATERLLDAGLIRLKNIDPEPRFDMLQPIDEYAGELFESDMEKDPVRDRFLQFYVDLAKDISPSLLTVNYNRNWLPMLRTDYENFREAFQIALFRQDKKSAATLINAVGTYWMFEGHQNEGLLWLSQAGLNEPGDWRTLSKEEVHVYANSMLCSGIFLFFPARFEEAIRDLKIGRDMFETIQDYRGMSRCLTYLGLISLSTGDLEGKSYFNEAIRRGNESGDYFSVFISTTFLSEYYLLTGDSAQAIQQIGEIDFLLNQRYTGPNYAVMQSYQPIFYVEKGNVFLYAGDLETARQAFEESIRLFDQSGLKTSKGYAFVGLAIVHGLRGDYAHAKKTSLRGLSTGRELGDVIIILVNLKVFLSSLIGEGEWKSSLPLLDEVFAFIRHYKYASWTGDKITDAWIQGLLDQKQLKTNPGTDVPKITLDELIQKTLSLATEG